MLSLINSVGDEEVVGAMSSNANRREKDILTEFPSNPELFAKISLSVQRAKVEESACSGVQITELP